MASSLPSSVLPLCSSCTRRLANLAVYGWRPFQQHVRGKKKLANHSDIMIVRLLKDVKGYGKRGAFVPVPRGMGRNQWIPQRTAEYVPYTQLRALRLSNTSIERDFEFGTLPPIQAAVKPPPVQTARPIVRPSIKLEQLTPERKSELINIFLPATLTFQRPVVEPSISSAASDPSADRITADSASLPIYGSVSTQDVANHIRESLSHNPEAARVQTSDLDVRFVLHEGRARQSEGDGEESESRIKHLGEYELDIQIKGSEGTIKRRLRVIPSIDA